MLLVQTLKHKKTKVPQKICNFVSLITPYSRYRLITNEIYLMIDISTSFVGLQLKSPIIVGSSGLTRSLDKVKSFAEAGAGAVILKSLFEEQIEAQIGNLNNYNDYTEGAEYLTKPN